MTRSGFYSLCGSRSLNADGIHELRPFHAHLLEIQLQQADTVGLCRAHAMVMGLVKQGSPYVVHIMQGGDRSRNLEETRTAEFPHPNESLEQYCCRW